jgi:peptidoglycan/LPS O-acetylase OafA/YrhL
VLLGFNPPDGIERAGEVMVIIGYSAVAVLFACAIVFGATDTPSVWTTIGRWRWLAWLSVYSYGIYMLSGPTRLLMERTGLTADDFAGRWLSPLTATAIAASIGIAGSIGSAYLSWHLFERRINALKRWVPYGRGELTEAHRSQLLHSVEAEGRSGRPVSRLQGERD